MASGCSPPRARASRRSLRLHDRIVRGRGRSRRRAQGGNSLAWPVGRCDGRDGGVVGRGCFFHVDVKNEQTGKVENWALELGNPNALLRAGWTPNSVKIGDEVTVEGSAAKDGSNIGNARTVMLNGKRMFAASSQGVTP